MLRLLFATKYKHAVSDGLDYQFDKRGQTFFVLFLWKVSILDTRNFNFYSEAEKHVHFVQHMNVRTIGMIPLPSSKFVARLGLRT